MGVIHHRKIRCGESGKLSNVWSEVTCSACLREGVDVAVAFQRHEADNLTRRYREALEAVCEHLGEPVPNRKASPESIAARICAKVDECAERTFSRGRSVATIGAWV